MKARPLLGGPFGSAGRFMLTTTPCVVRGLHAVRFAVVEPATGAVLALEEEKRAALDAARARLRDHDAPTNEREPQQLTLWPREVAERPIVDRKRPISRRRRDIFAKSGGRCFYCGCTITLDAFEIEHQMPRALGGSDGIANLVASCFPCNRRKRDRTAVEFIAAQAQAREDG